MEPHHDERRGPARNGDVLIRPRAWAVAVAVACGGCVGLPPAPLQVSDAASGWGGMAPLSDGRYLVVHDNKSDQPGARLAAFDPAVERLRTRAHPIAVADWRDADGPANDLEAVCALPSRRDEFLLAESGRYQGRFGRIFHVRVEGWSARVLHVLHLPDDEAGSAPANHEGLACLHDASGVFHLLLGERGGNAPRPQGSVRLGRYRSGAAIEWSAQVIPVRVPGPWPAGFDVRDIADLAVAADGSVWAVAAMDEGDAGPFRSTIWRLGTWRVQADPGFVPESRPRNEWILDGLKVEALALPMPAMRGARLVIATDDEDYGAIWRPLATPATEP